ncbi:uncharacterized protein LOC128889237 [Hylaeus anthracinus]|uniref:uncharacterized protein LOC128889237 n=1 Tax=Hylaeus anthracinus TaxID=313031 RepID=UPI0023B98C4F|nr:uncharacterized protein LOC128889237 [Hylaeus anthracinus]
MLNFPCLPKDSDRCLKWFEACGTEDLFQLPPNRLRNRVVYGDHFEIQYRVGSKLTSHAVPSCNLSAPATSIEQQEELVMEIEEEEERQPVLTVGYQDNVGPGTRRDFDALAYNVLPGSSRGCTDKRNQVQPAIRIGLKGDILKMIRSSNLTKPRKLKIYKAVARILKSARQLRRRRSSGVPELL